MARGFNWKKANKQRDRVIHKTYSAKPSGKSKEKLDIYLVYKTRFEYIKRDLSEHLKSGKEYKDYPKWEQFELAKELRDKAWHDYSGETGRNITRGGKFTKPRYGYRGHRKGARNG